MPDSVRPHRWQPTRLPRPWDSPGKNTGVGCHFLLQCMKVKSESEVAQPCPTLSDPTDCSQQAAPSMRFARQEYWNGNSLLAQMVKNMPAMQETQVQSQGWEDPLEKEMATHSSILDWRIPQTEEPGRLYSPWGHKELDTTE